MAKSSTGLEENLASALCYLLGFITGIIFLVVDGKNTTIKFHAMQAILWSLLLIVISVIFGIIAGILAIATLGVGALLIFPLIGLINLVFLLSWLWLMFQAYSGKKWKFPIVGNMAEGMAK